MLPKRQRLTTAAFAQYFQKGRRQHGTYLQLIYVPSPRFYAAVVVGKKVYKTAVDRNRLRRQLYAVLHEHTTLPVVCLVLAKPAAKSVSSAIVKAELITMLAQLPVKQVQ